eukprot:3403510-Pyramimonas_sp.AAC.1
MITLRLPQNVFPRPTTGWPLDPSPQLAFERYPEAFHTIRPQLGTERTRAASPCSMTSEPS